MGIGFRSIFGPTTKETISGLNNKFKNTPLEPYLPLVVQFFFGTTHREFENSILLETRNNILSFIDEMIQLALLMRDLKTKKLKGRGWQISSVEDLSFLYSSVESHFFEKITDLWDILDRYGFDEYNPIAPPEWHEALKDFPCREAFTFEDAEVDEDGNEVEYGDRALSLFEIDYLLKTLKKYVKKVKGFHIDIDTTVANRFVEFMISHNVPTNRAIYRCMYSALDCFNGIPPEVKQSHATTISTTDPQSNYIKSIVTRLKNKTKTNA